MFFLFCIECSFLLWFLSLVVSPSPSPSNPTNPSSPSPPLSMSSIIRRGRKFGDQNPFCKRRQAQTLNTDVSVPSYFRCPISLELMRDPVTLSTGITFDRQSIEEWLATGNSTCPVTKQPLTAGEYEVTPNHTIRRMVQDWCVANQSYGVERIPTPKIPVNHHQISEILSDIVSASHSRNGSTQFRELVGKLKEMAIESERNRKCIASAGTGRVLASIFSSLTGGSIEDLEEILTALTTISPLDDEACQYLGSPESYSLLTNLISRKGDINAVLVLKDVLSSNINLTNGLVENEGLIPSLIDLMKDPTSPLPAKKASLIVTFYLVSLNEKIASIFVELGIVPLLMEILVDSEKSSCEKALSIFDSVCSYESGRGEAYGNALTVPVLVKKMFRVSEMATETVVSVLWKLCSGVMREDEGAFLVEALNVGAFQKLLLLLQVGCAGETKERVSKLLKMLNGFKGRLDCVDNLDFKGLKRSF